MRKARQFPVFLKKPPVRRIFFRKKQEPRLIQRNTSQQVAKEPEAHSRRLPSSALAELTDDRIASRIRHYDQRLLREIKVRTNICRPNRNSLCNRAGSVSYTHLDVYKRQSCT